MKALMIGAGALLLSTSAMAGVLQPKYPADDKVAADKTVAAPVLVSAAAYQDVALPAHSAAIDDGAAYSMDKVDAALLHQAGFDTTPRPLTAKSADGMEMAALVTGAKAEGEVHHASAMTGGDAMTQPVQATARSSWRACEPGPGDDNCIQLYERGVPEAYAAWRDENVQMAMAEPDPMMVPASAPKSAADDMAMAEAETDLMPAMRTAEQMQAASALGKQEVDRVALAAASPAEPVYEGVGGPYEPVDYPRCTSRSDDNCQQGS